MQSWQYNEPSGLNVDCNLTGMQENQLWHNEKLALVHTSTKKVNAFTVISVYNNVSKAYTYHYIKEQWELNR